MATGNIINLNSAGVVGYDGAGTFVGNSVTNHAVQVGSATSSGLTSLTVGTNGQVLVGSSAANPVFATLTGTGGITFTTGAGTLAINNTSGISWAVTTVDASIVAGNGYIANKAGLLTMTLPASGAIGDIFEITGINSATGWRIAQNANQQIFLGTSSTTVGVGGSISSINIRDSIKCVCVVSGVSTIWNVLTSAGNLTIV